MAFTTAPSVNQPANSLTLVEFNYSSTFNIVKSCLLTLDSVPGDTNHENLAYEIVDMQFYNSQFLLLLISRAKTGRLQNYANRGNPTSHADSISSSDLMFSWLVMVPVQSFMEKIDRLQMDLPMTKTPLIQISNKSILTLLPKLNISELLTKRHCETLPWQAAKVVANGERTIVFVLFENLSTCRVYLIERPELEETSPELQEQTQTDKRDTPTGEN